MPSTWKMLLESVATDCLKETEPPEEIWKNVVAEPSPTSSKLKLLNGAFKIQVIIISKVYLMLTFKFGGNKFVNRDLQLYHCPFQ